MLITRYDQLLAKLINQGGAAALFSSRRPKNIENERILLCLKIAKIDIEGGGRVKFLVEKNDPGHKNSFF